MKNSIVSSLFAITATLFAVGCSTPKTKDSYVPRSAGYEYGQPPAQRILADQGRQYDRHARALQEERLAHEARMARMDFQAKEQAYALEKGLRVPQQQPVVQAPTVQQNWAPAPASAQVWQQPPNYVPATYEAPYPGPAVYYPSPVQIQASWGWRTSPGYSHGYGGGGYGPKTSPSYAPPCNTGGYGHLSSPGYYHQGGGGYGPVSSPGYSQTQYCPTGRR